MNTDLSIVDKCDSRFRESADACFVVVSFEHNLSNIA